MWREFERKFKKTYSKRVFWTGAYFFGDAIALSQRLRLPFSEGACSNRWSEIAVAQLIAA